MSSTRHNDEEISSSHGNDTLGREDRPSSSRASSSSATHRRPPLVIASSDFTFSAAQSSDSVPLEILATDSQPSLVSDHSSGITSFEGITSSSINSDLDDLEQFGHHALSEVDMPASMGSSGGGFMWDEEMGDIFSFGVSDSSSLMHHPEIGSPVDQSDGTNMPDSSSSTVASGRRKPGIPKDQPSCSSSSKSFKANHQPDPLNFVRSRSPFVESPFTFDESYSELEQCTSSSDLIVVKQEGELPKIAEENEVTFSLPMHTGKVCNVLPDRPIKPEEFLAESRSIGSCPKKGKSKDHIKLAKSSHPSNLSSSREPLEGRSDQQSHLLHVNVDTDSSTGKARATGGVAQCFPSDILTTISPPKASATIMPHLQPSNAQMGNSVVTNTAEAGGSTPTNEAISHDSSVPGAVLSREVPFTNQEERMVQKPQSTTSSVIHSAISLSVDHIDNEKASGVNRVSSCEVQPHEQKSIGGDKPSGSSIPAKCGVQKTSSGSKTTSSSSNSIPVTLISSQENHVGSSQAVNSTSTTIPSSVKPVTSSEESTITISTLPGPSLPLVSISAPLQPVPPDARSRNESNRADPGSKQKDSLATRTMAGPSKDDISASEKTDTSGPSTASSSTTSGIIQDVPQNRRMTEISRTAATASSGEANRTSCPEAQTFSGSVPSENAEMEVIKIYSSDEEEPKSNKGPSRDSDVSNSDIDDILVQDMSSESAIERKGKKRKLDGKDKEGNKDSLYAGAGVEPSKEEKDRGVIAIKMKRVFISRGREPLDGLPADWIAIPHRSGLDVYMHTPTRVCTWSRPYFIGTGSARKHNVPLAAIRCLHYKRAKAEEELGDVGSSNKRQCTNARTEGNSNETMDGQASKPQSSGDGAPLPEDGTDTPPVPPEAGDAASCPTPGVTENGGEADNADRFKNKLKYKPDEALEPEELHEYIKKVFDFKTVSVKRFQSWSERRNFYKQERKKQMEEKRGREKEEAKEKESVDIPKMPLVPTFEATVKSASGDILTRKKELSISMTDKSPTSILQEYCQRVLRIHPTYVIEERNNANNPFEAVVVIEGQKYGKGQAPSKKQARIQAAIETLKILIPNVMSQTEEMDDTSMAFFDHIAIDDRRVADLCVKTGNLTPYEVLSECKQRMFGKKDTAFSFDVTVSAHSKITYEMSLGPHMASGHCKNAKVGKQLGAQKILQQIYPKVKTWGGIIKIYGRGVQEMLNAKKEEERSIFALSKVKKNKPNEGILKKLKQEMRKAYSAKIQARKDQQNSTSSEQPPVPPTSQAEQT